MGCVFGSQKEETPPEPVQQDTPIFGLKKKQRFLLKSSWRGVVREKQQFYTLIVNKLLAKDPNLLKLFPKFEKLDTAEERAESEPFQNAMELGMEELDDSLASLQDRAEELEPTFISIGKRLHASIPNLTVQHIQLLEEPFLESTEAVLQERYTAQMEAIYKILISNILQSLCKGLEAH